MKKIITLITLFLTANLMISAQTIKGDMNGDGKIDAQDITILVNTVLGKVKQEFVKKDTVTIYKAIDKNSYLVFLDGNGADEGTMNVQEETFDTTFKLSKNTYTRTDYKFVGWNTKADGTGISYSDEEEVKNITDKDNIVITLYAQWEEIFYVYYGTASRTAPSAEDLSAILAAKDGTYNAEKGWTLLGKEKLTGSQVTFTIDTYNWENLPANKGQKVQWCMIKSNSGYKLTKAVNPEEAELTFTSISMGDSYNLQHYTTRGYILNSYKYYIDKAL